jgi:outer membrane protein assembly factor BamB
MKWGSRENVRWRVELPGRSNGSPIVWGNRVFVAQASGQEKKRTVMCFDRADGKVLWQSGVTYSESESTHPENPYCSGTPATDGQRVVACFGSAGLYCFDLAGKELWHRDLGKLNHMFGNAISPIIAGDLVVLNYGPGEGARLVAVDKHKGSTVWEAKPPEVDPSEKTFKPERFGGPGMLVLMSLMMPADKDKDTRLSLEELVGVASSLFDKVDPQKSGAVTKEQFVKGMGEISVSPGAPGAPPANLGVVAGPGLFAAMDADHDGTLKRAEAEATFQRWYTEWGQGATEALAADQILDGLNAILPPPKNPPASPTGFGGDAGPGGSWSTPLLIRSNGRDELVISMPNRLAAYDLATGKLLWFSKGLPDSVQTMPVWDEKHGFVVASGGDMSGGTMIAVRPGGSGDVTDTHRVWRLTRLKGTIGTGVAFAGLLYVVSDDGFALCYDLAEGKKLWQKRLQATGDKGSSWSSLLLAGDRIYAPNQSGDVFVMKAGREFEVLGTNSVNEPTNASLAASDGQLFLRTDKALWCIAR